MDITLYRETDQDITFQYYEADGVTERTLNGATVYFTAKRNKFDNSADDATAVILKTVTSHTDAVNGLTTISLSDTDTNVDPQTYFYDIKVEESDNKKYLAQTGLCQVVGTPTNR